MLGKLLDGRYEILQVLGAGGFGETYLAHDIRRPGKPLCVVKRLKTVSTDTNFLLTARRLFKSEAETQEKLGHHLQIPRLLAYFEENKEFYLVQDYIKGHTLNQELKTGELWQEDQVIQLLQEILPILKFVHNQGVIHRDIKPDNIIRGQQNQKLYLLDFGAVKQINVDAVNASHTANYTVAIGTPGYMASEQARGQPRPSSDIYSLGIIAVQALTGVKPSNLQYDKDTGEIIWEHQATASPELKAIISRMVADHFRDRYLSTSAVLEDLAQLTPTGVIPPPPTPITPHYTPLNHSVSKLTTVAPLPDFIPISQRKTLAIAPPPPAVQPIRQLSSRSLGKIIQTPLLRLGVFLGILLSVSFALTFALRGTWALVRDKLRVEDKVGLINAKNCTVTATDLNVRSRAKGDVIKSIRRGTIVFLSGQQQNQWVEIKQPLQGWVYNQYLDCKVSNQPTVTLPQLPKIEPPRPQKTQEPPVIDKSEDNNNQNQVGRLESWRKKALFVLGLERDINQENQQSEVVPALPSPKPENTPIPIPRVNRVPSPRPPQVPSINNNQQHNQNTFVDAVKKYRAGDIQGAIAIAQAIPKYSQDYRRAQANLPLWRDEVRAKNVYNQAQQAYNRQQWDDTLAFLNSYAPASPHWRNKFLKLAQQARQQRRASRINNQPPPQPQPTPTPTATPTPLEPKPPSSNPSPTPTPIATPTPTQTPTPPSPESETLNPSEGKIESPQIELPSTENEMENPDSDPNSELQDDEVYVEKSTKTPSP